MNELRVGLAAIISCRNHEIQLRFQAHHVYLSWNWNHHFNWEVQELVLYFKSIHVRNHVIFLKIILFYKSLAFFLRTRRRAARLCIKKKN
jgi:hypothetical protein